ncbi:hypothetical protein ZOSMA_194G00200 [Zostera marina]|uniref:FLZ-type domain-containing protein n=1 Tax=Zostera marina TaxID=29655 RepID=A0A0K9PRB3_ZOSMR|nr:hypothetical protein ZOSMA_194G00200 [Zostera marina]
MMRTKSLSDLSPSSSTKAKKKTRETIIEQSNAASVRKNLRTCHGHRLPGVARRVSNDINTPTIFHFLQRCANCRFNLFPGFDTYIYRGDTAFCSNDCRKTYIKQALF